MWNPFNRYLVNRLAKAKEAEAKRRAEVESVKQAEHLRRVNAEIAAARRTPMPASKPLWVVPNDLTAQRAVRQDVQRGAAVQAKGSGGGGGSSGSSYTDDLSALQTQMLLNGLQTSSSDSYSAPPSCSPSSDSSSSSSSSSSASDCSSGSSDSGGGSCGGCD